MQDELKYYDGYVPRDFDLSGSLARYKYDLEDVYDEVVRISEERVDGGVAEKD